MTTMKSISSAIESVDAKKENLRKAFENLQSHSSSLSSFTLQWKDLEDHFDSIKKSIEVRFKELESKQFKLKEEPMEVVTKKLESNPSISTNSHHPMMKSLCIKMDGIGLRSYILNNRKELDSIKNEIGFALQSASDPAKLILDSMKGFYAANSNKGDKDGELASLRRTCHLLLEQLFAISSKISISKEIRDKALKLAVEWKGKVSKTGGENNPLEPLALLQLLAAYGLVSSFNVDEVLDLAVSIARRKQAIDLVRSLGITDKIPDFVQKLTSNGKQLEAVKFVYAFELVDKFPPVPLLKDYFKQSKKVAQDIRNKGNHSIQSLNEATAKELAAVRAIIKCIEEHNLESEYPRGILDMRVEQLEKQKADRKRTATSSTPADKRPQQSGNKRPRPEATRTVSVPSAPQTHIQPVSSDRFLPYISSSTQYGLVGTTPTVDPYMTGTIGPYGLVANPVRSYGFSPPRSHMYSSESHLTAGLYDRPMNYGAHGMLPPPHHSSFYP
ncbi:Frigida-like protein [Thalictrum thalictroides]|uniref:FRIGIDA-like protein n=1 Tax=Thalictrum thalictroides TaxID=46969 RepID=A0A7J6UYK1_THATH|nr:Frigida-like protein [Thalictrum thalictroides]